MLGLEQSGRGASRHDPGGWGASLVNDAELVLGCLDAVKARSVAEIGALGGDLTAVLLRRARRVGGSVAAIEPFPHEDLEALDRAHEDLTLVRQASLAALAQIPLPEAIIVDGDHNYYTVSRELQLIASRCADDDRRLPLILLHDVCWPHGRRDDYYAPDAIPAEHRRQITPEAGLYPGDPGTRAGGVPYHHPASHEGGPRNGVLTAAEDFVKDRAQLWLAVVPAFFGLGVIADRTGPHAQSLRTLLEPWDSNPYLARLEHNRVLQLANTQMQLASVRRAQARLVEQHRELGRQRELLERMHDSRAVRAVELLWRLRGRSGALSRRAIADLLDD